MLKKIFILVLFILTSLAVVYCWQIKNNREKTIDKNFVESSLINLKLNQEKTKILKIPEEEALKIEKVIAIFEEYKYKKDFVSAIKIITLPENQEEEGWLDHLLGNDLAELNNGKSSPRFLNKVNYHLLVGYNIEKIIEKNEIFYAYIEELRVLNVAEEGTSPKYEVEIQELIFELLNNEGNYEISKYYHINPSSIANLKYEGFAAF